MPSSHPPAENLKLQLSRLLPWIVWSLGCLFYVYESMLQVSLSVMSDELMRDFSVTSQALGLLSGIYFFSYAFMQLPCGMMTDYFGPRRLLTLATLVCALSTIAFAYTDSFFAACCARFMMGAGSAFAAVCALKLAASWFSASKFAFLTGLLIAIGMSGAMAGEAPLALLVDSFGWRTSLHSIGIIGVFLGILIYIIVKDTPASHVPMAKRSSEELSLWDSLLELIKNKQLWLVAIYGSLMFLGTPVFCGLWGGNFLMLKLGVSKEVAASYNSLIFVGWIIGSPLWGFFSETIGRRKPPLYIGCIGALPCSLLFIYAPLGTGLLMKLILVGFGFFSSAFLPAFTVAKELCNKRYVATGLGFMNMMNSIGIALMQPVIGLILDKMWQGEVVDATRIYPLEAYQVGLGLLPLGMFVSFILLPFIRETYCTSVKN